MPGPRKKSLIRGLYAATSLGEAQAPKRAATFARRMPCRATPHQWLFGDVCAVCAVCGWTQPKDKVKP